MNKKLGLAVAGALVAFSSAANAGITIPAGDWTVDIGGVVNAYYTSTRHTGDNVGLGQANATGQKTESNITTGLLPNYLAVSGKTRQNDLDIAFTISLNPGASRTSSGNQGSQQENRQAFMTIGDASWGSIKLGKDLGVYASDAILNDMTLLGVGSGAGFLAGNTTTLGHIGTGYNYADWKSQVAYSTPNFNGFQATVALTQAWNATSVLNTADTLSTTAGTVSRTLGTTISKTSTARGGSAPAFEGKASYSFTADQVTGKVWVSGLSQEMKGLERAEAWDIGANVNVAGFGLTGYYGQGSGTGTTVQFRDGYDASGKARDSEDWYVQGTYTLPTVGTKLGVSYGESSLDGNSSEAASITRYENSQWTVGAYHPLTKSVNLVAEYSDVEGKFQKTGSSSTGKDKTVSLGAILFF
jgi:predicted porin